MKNVLLTITIVLATAFAYGDLLKLSGGTLQIENIILNKTATTPAAVEMKLVGAGLRSKNVLFVDTKVYVLELFSTEAEKFSRDQNALKSIALTHSVAIRMTFLRTVDAQTVANSYKEAFAANGVSLKDPAINGFLNVVAKGGDAQSGKSLTILMYQDVNNGTSLVYEDTQLQQASLSGGRDLQEKVLSIWLGQPADSGLKTLKNSLIKPVY